MMHKEVCLCLVLLIIVLAAWLLYRGRDNYRMRKWYNQDYSQYENLMYPWGLQAFSNIVQPVDFRWPMEE